MSLLLFIAPLLCIGLAVFVLIQDWRSFVHRTFAAGMIVLALEAICTGLSIQAEAYSAVVRWQQGRVIFTALLPGSWLLFSLSFARARFSEFIVTWRWVIVAAFSVPLTLVIVFGRFFFFDLPIVDASSRWVLGLGWSGYVFTLVFLLSAVLILANLERTLRALTGSMRWQVKFLILGVGGLFAIRLYTCSQALLLSALTATLEEINIGALVVASGLMFSSFVRTRLLQAEVYLSQSFLYHSFTVVLVGIYLLAVGVLAEVVGYMGKALGLPLVTFFIFLTLLGLAVLLLSDELRARCKRFLSRHLQRPRYDYRTQWTTFTQRTTSLLNARALCASVTKMAAETFGVGCTSIWLWDEIQERLVLGGSTVFSETQARNLKMTRESGRDFIHVMQEHLLPVVWGEGSDERETLQQASQDTLEALREARVQYGVSLVVGEEFLGVMTLDKKVAQEPFSIEDHELFKTIADQTAGSLLHLKLSQQLVKTKELEVFQTMSAFFLHDLKNLASTLSLTVQNLPVYYEDPAFREDALRVMTASVDKINTLCSRLSLATQKIELQRTDTDLNALIGKTLADLNGAIQATLTQDLRPLPQLHLDPDQLQKGLLNLVLNANDATGPGGKIHITTAQENGRVVLSVRDNGCGMSKDFIERSLFRLFKTTKSKGSGIGLFQSKMIVEAHQGRIEVESEEGKGSVFHMILPIVKS